MAVRKRVSILVIVCALLLAVGIGPRAADPTRALPGPSAERAATTMPYAGRLTDRAGQPVADGAYDLSFGLYGTESGGQVLWSEVQRGVPVSKGEFLTALGSVAPIPATAFDGQTGWLVQAKGREQLAKALLEMIKDREISINFGRAGRKRAEILFSAEGMVNKYQNLYLELMNR